MYAPGRELPPYAFLPGRDPHPTRHPEGHSHGREASPPAYMEAGLWAANEDYLHGVDLYNGGFLWEAHEAWEGVWHASRQDEHQADHVQGLIQCAAACLKILMEQPTGLESLTRLGTEKLERVASEAGNPFMGVDLGSFVVAMRAFASSAPADIEGRPLIVLER